MYLCVSIFNKRLWVFGKIYNFKNSQIKISKHSPNPLNQRSDYKPQNESQRNSPIQHEDPLHCTPLCFQSRCIFRIDHQHLRSVTRGRYRHSPSRCTSEMLRWRPGCRRCHDEHLHYRIQRVRQSLVFQEDAQVVQSLHSVGLPWVHQPGHLLRCYKSRLFPRKWEKTMKWSKMTSTCSNWVCAEFTIALHQHERRLESRRDS